MISASMIVKNEEVMLGRCLDSLKGFDEVVIVDTGSTDKTGEIARKYDNVKYFENEYVWNDNFAEARNFSQSKCKGDWIFVIDGDEWAEEGTAERAKEIVSAENGTKALNIKVIAASKDNMHIQPRLYRNIEEVFWKAPIHNYLSVVGEKMADLTIYYDYSPAHKEDPDRALRILKKVVTEKPDSVREMFYLGREYGYRRDFITAAYWYERYLKKGFWAPEIAEVYLQLAIAYWNLQRGDEARDTCLQAIKVNADFKEAIEFMATMSGPKNKKRWLVFASTAESNNVLFNRKPVPSERDANYYDKIYSANYDSTRYSKIYEKVGKWIGDKKVLDIACGLGELSRYVKNYKGFDFSETAIKIADNENVWVGSAYDANNYDGDYDTYVMLEVLEHLDDIKVLQNIHPHPLIRNGKEVIFSVPSFEDPSHIRVFTEKIMRERYGGIIDIDTVIRFNLDKKWVEGGTETSGYILLVRGKIR